MARRLTIRELAALIGAGPELVLLPFEPTPQRRPVVLAYGGGLDSFAALVESIRRGEPPEWVVMADVGDPEHQDPGEWPSTYKHVDQVVKPLCLKHGIKFVMLTGDTYPVRDARSLFSWLSARNQIPVTGPARICTIVAKVERFESWMRDTFPGRSVEVWVGFEAGEEGRAAKDPNRGTKRKPRPGDAVRVNRYPLIEWDLCRCRCKELVQRLGFPLPGGSACVFCPYGTKGDWQKLDRELPAQFQATEHLEAKKPLTSNGKKLSIMGYRTLKDAQKRPTGEYKAPPLREFIRGTYKPRPKPCGVCGAKAKATKEVGCGMVA